MVLPQFTKLMQSQVHQPAVSRKLQCIHFTCMFPHAGEYIYDMYIYHRYIILVMVLISGGSGGCKDIRQLMIRGIIRYQKYDEMINHLGPGK